MAGARNDGREHFRVIAPDKRGYGRTVHPGGPVSYPQPAGDVRALIDVLGLDQPLICGFSDGACTATVLELRHPGSVRAIVNHSGYDFFNPEAPSFAMSRQMLGDSADATHTAPEAMARTVNTSPEMRATFESMKADHDDAQGSDRWKTLITETCDRYTQYAGYTFADLRTTAVPTLVLTGDRDEYCSAEDGVPAYRALPHGEPAVLPNHGHCITPAAVQVVQEFFLHYCDL
ncbi:MAG: alpha/beta hydrolase [Pseudonocardiales bacterium]|nr:alpha/beta hydrolase [Pseudonocardiales bacterium]MBW0009325.1 alpha/beta hydrolase [Pseudonocardiales bacterium]